MRDRLIVTAGLTAALAAAMEVAGPRETGPMYVGRKLEDPSEVFVVVENRFRSGRSGGKGYAAGKYKGSKAAKKASRKGKR